MKTHLTQFIIGSHSDVFIIFPSVCGEVNLVLGVTLIVRQWGLYSGASLVMPNLSKGCTVSFDISEAAHLLRQARHHRVLHSTTGSQSIFLVLNVALMMKHCAVVQGFTRRRAVVAHKKY